MRNAYEQTATLESVVEWNNVTRNDDVGVEALNEVMTTNDVMRHRR
jgi:hypothetical protein